MAIPVSELQKINPGSVIELFELRRLRHYMAQILLIGFTPVSMMSERALKK